MLELSGGDFMGFFEEETYYEKILEIMYNFNKEGNLFFEKDSIEYLNEKEWEDDYWIFKLFL